MIWFSMGGPSNQPATERRYCGCRHTHGVHEPGRGRCLAQVFNRTTETFERCPCAKQRLYYTLRKWSE